ncbi:stearoyl-CoA 9-desaturase [Sugiyamaella lignohabitans]|uniref:Acyl-CoA desaturase n=1 Tax=Sugiyamaella lignohabitans TaxID=796027 RepID=A0A167CD60_9ASCO|nr:stearoyl-CoA 9-desaturase [Sugiyamaella lignohabitans]ANB11534.1 stearoyl-CoA 9-desaturase [Sugiyamaella lignohabitans]
MSALEQLSVEEVEAIATGKASRDQTNINRKKNASTANTGAFVSAGGVEKKKVHISEQPFTWSNWYLHINWINTTLIFIYPMIGFCFVPFVHLSLKTFIWSFIYYFMTGLGITAGYHRMWSHRAYSARLPLQIFLLLVGSGAGEGSVKWWSNGHRTHHRFTDTEKDPYDARRGFMFSHMGWMMFHQNPQLKGRTDISDLIADPLVRFQHKHYLYFLFAMAYVFPTLVAGFGWGDWTGGLLYAGVLRLFVVHQSTFCVNSLAHWIGEQPFDDRRTPRDHAITAFATLGEGYHNFHHEFPSDYRNALKWYQYDPTKMFIWTMKQLGLAYNLQKFSQNAIEQGLVQQKQKKLDKWRARLNWGVPIEQLPVIEFDDFKQQTKEQGKCLVLISGIVHDITDFIEHHPGGKALIKSAIGKDGTAVFNGGVYNHSNAAHNLLATMRVAVIRGGCEVEVWKKAQSEKKDVNIIQSTSGDKIVRAGEQATRLAETGVSGRAA